nr:S8 family serine peptidase [candidate division Zixibacteria bacterium]
MAVIDEGVRNDHSDLYPRVFGDNEFAGGHGTKVAGIIGASTNNINLISGLSGNSKIYSGCIYELDYSEVADKIVVAVDIGAGILNNSWAFDPADQFIISVRSSMAYAYKMNRIVVCAKGNDDSSEPHYPSDYGQGIISVGAYGTDGRRAKFSNIGNGIDIVAPGDFITSLDAGSQDDWTRYFGGTSAAAPHAAGVAALLKSYDNTLYNDDIENIINLTAKDNKEDPAVIGYDDYTGWGNLNAKAAFDILQLPNMLAHLEADGGNQYSNTSAMTMVFFDIPNMADGVYIAKRYEVRKSVTFPHSYLESPHAWGRGVAARGYSAANPNFGMNYAGVIPESVTETSCVFRTWVYEIWTVSGTYVGWKPCAPEDVKFAYTVLGEYEVQKPAYFNVNNHFEHQAVRVCWSDPNPYEEGWILERKSATVPVWKVIDTIPNNDYDYVYYDDYYPIGGETYTYRVKPYTADQQNAPYSDEATVTTRPHRAEDIAVYATDFSYGVPTVTGCGDVPLKINTDLISAAKDIAGAPELISEEDENWHLLYGNDITARWIPSPHQKYPIVKYFIRLSHPHVTMGDIYDVGPDTCFYICPVDANSTYSVYVYGISSIGDTSLPDIQKCQHRQYECLPRKCNEKQ